MDEKISKTILARSIFYTTVLNPKVQGGPGLSPETAWIMPNEKHFDAVSAEYHVVAVVFGCRPSGQKLCKKDGHTYDVLTATIPDGNGGAQQVDVWFDITAKFSGK